VALRGTGRSAALPVALRQPPAPTGTGMLALACGPRPAAGPTPVPVAVAGAPCAPTGLGRRAGPGQARGRVGAPVGPTPLPEAAGAAGGGQPASYQLSQTTPATVPGCPEPPRPANAEPVTPALWAGSGTVSLCDCHTAALPHAALPQCQPASGPATSERWGKN
jgi:hypothetical protein